MRPTTAIFGQSPNASGWKRLAEQVGVHAAETECARTACTGEVGILLASLVGDLPRNFYRKVQRFNLNARWNGKRNGVDIFDTHEALATAARIMLRHPEIRKVICLGRKVGKIVGFDAAAPFLTTIEWTSGRLFLLLPHPSGRNRWWNKPENKRLASRVFRDFLRE